MRSLIWITATFFVCLTALYAVADPYTPTSTPAPTKTEATPPPAPKAAPTPAPTTDKAKAESPGKDAKATMDDQTVQPAPVEADWHARAEKWFSSSDLKVRRKEMRAATKALKQSCFYCHTRGFKGYKDNKLISQQMMAMSAEHDVTCADCHAGKRELTEMGETAQHMWRLVQKKKVFCEHCHTPHKRFAELTPEGKAFKAEGQKGSE